MYMCPRESECVIIFERSYVCGHESWVYTVCISFDMYEGVHNHRGLSKSSTTTIDLQICTRYMSRARLKIH